MLNLGHVLYLIDRSGDECWNLSSDLCPCRGITYPPPEKKKKKAFLAIQLILYYAGPPSPVSKHLRSWLDYYEWRCIPLHSPVALVLHWV